MGVSPIAVPQGLAYVLISGFTAEPAMTLAN